MDTQSEMLAMLSRRQPNFSLERPFYTDPDFFKLDMELIWYRDWVFIGHECELPKPGSFFTAQIGDYAIMALKAEDGVIRGFHNTCRHRGSKVCTQDKGVTAKLVCPYHQWAYGLDGKLLFARQMGESFDKADYALGQIACETVEGSIFINLSERPYDFAPLREHLTPYASTHRLRDAKVAFEATIIEKGNWKLVWENNRECYHCAANHPELCRVFPESPTGSSAAGGAADQEVMDFWARCESAGIPSRYKVDPTGQFRTTRTPLVNGAVSYTADGRPGVSRFLSDNRKVEGIGALLFYHYPSTWNHYLDDHTVTFRVLPISATETAVTTKWLVHKDAVAGIDYDVDRLTHVWTETNDQDRRVVEFNAAGILSPAYRPGPYSDSYEGGVSQFVEWYASFMLSRIKGDKPHLLSSVA
ncbi:aromatic ring-hydroxylating dioxygenase subunit alpha [Mesorhizobium sp.]|uniref:aromatic ring-hydroxylating oxygenase subunit alpha n=1 Tax=Mesorhizobium sp. TaxID=1871066 RepID=UPI000FE7FFB8|nr:aromatic ring-hydroxylating dioxygenase subunit alpha [Mesorhizobium sp.]RWB66275.1 MAG: aromatic ring-hydroxylating dioxygenase subunit alpha [Mesorhizobium sp.]